ncbi:heme lyase CcmF/NrfE family subunit [Hydrocarboniclastica marina]|uniref:Heme lyase CcmF/NrfE family subunit n=1 Tax=Hydrocarboniclastica marina TaxID=2259620 RepID=A0A4P7XFK1_9ALTE|nr:heme lyase CcmF/NrfE family subunit [Hydrocarboniclastica marina]MAL98543.1 heme lyase NrfEFG subunit NrfE [Alteromonadaceae bacterium]QCF25706.1 heme lyase CcmF/NrfE family subunit [Hydrocarboniclastica marina]
MFPELGHFALILALGLTLFLCAVPLLGALRNNLGLMAFARPLAAGQFVFVGLAFVCLTYSFLADDFSVAYVANNSNSLLPWYYKASAVWGGHEGSLLLWILMLSGWTLAVAIFSRHLPEDMVARVLSVLGMVGLGFLLFILMTSNPFDRLLPNVPADGADLNPLLQDFGLIIHPPMLYMGYVGLSVAFAFAIAALSTGRLDSAWARWSRPWTTVAWAFLSLGIALGSWWAYYELGWGGWWFWDPVENASFLPWLAATALMHSLAVTEKRGAFKSWTVLLAILAFSMSLLGTFLVRSGVLTSVHSFAADPTRGMFILVLLGITIVGSLFLYALRAPVIHSRAAFTGLSRETFLLINNVVLVLGLIVVLLGTLFPLINDALGGGQLSVGEPYFNLVFPPLALFIGAALGIGIFTRWKKTPPSWLAPRLFVPAVLSVVIAALVPLAYQQGYGIGSVLGTLVSAWIVTTTLRDLWDKSESKHGRIVGLRKLSRSYCGMVAGHLGLASAIIGVTLVSNYGIETTVRMQVGDSVEVAGYEWHFSTLKQVEGPNFISNQAQFEVFDGLDHVATVFPEKRHYQVRQDMMTEAGIDAGVLRDLFVALGEPLAEGQAWAVRIQYKPMIRWIWLGAILMAIGGALAVSDKRYRARKLARSTSSTPAAGSHAGTRQAGERLA